MGKFKLVSRKRLIIVEGFIELKASEVAKEMHEPANAEEQAAEIVKLEEDESLASATSSQSVSEATTVSSATTHEQTPSQTDSSEVSSEPVNPPSDAQSAQKTSEVVKDSLPVISPHEARKITAQPLLTDDEFPYR